MSHDQEERRNQLSLFGLQVVSNRSSIAAAFDGSSSESTRLTLHVMEADEHAKKNAPARSIFEVHEQLLKRVKLF